MPIYSSQLWWPTWILESVDQVGGVELSSNYLFSHTKINIKIVHVMVCVREHAQFASEHRCSGTLDYYNSTVTGVWSLLRSRVWIVVVRTGAPCR